MNIDDWVFVGFCGFFAVWMIAVLVVLIQIEKSVSAYTERNIRRCGDCGKPLDPDEIEYYGHSCNACEGKYTGLL